MPPRAQFEKRCMSGALLLAVCIPSISAAEKADEPGAAHEPRKEDLREEITVAAHEIDPAGTMTGVASTLLDPRNATTPASNLTDLLTAIPGVAENGQGGLFQVLSIRGISRHRIRTLVDGMGMTSERRAGVATSFIDPFQIGSVEVVRGPATVLHGSGALGGSVLIQPRWFDDSAVELAYSTAGDEDHQAVGLGSDDWSLGLARRRARDGRAADGSRLYSRFEQSSAVLQRRWKGGTRIYDLVAIASYGEEIGKANTDYPERTTTYPRERHQLLKFATTLAGDGKLHAFFHNRHLVTSVEEGLATTRVANDSLDFGFRWEGNRDLGPRVALRCGVESFGRRGVDATEVNQTADGAGLGEPTVITSLADGRSDEAGAFATVGWEWGPALWEAGARYAWIRQRNGGQPERRLSALNGYLGFSRPLGGGFQLRGNVSTGLRFPSLSELFFNGTTGSGNIIGNPDLEAERSIGTEIGVRWIGPRLLIDAAVFRNRIEDYIERQPLSPLAPNPLTFRNLTSGTIRGFEWQGLYLPTSNLRLFWAGHRLEGRDGDDRPLADIPPDESRVGVGWARADWRLETALNHRGDKSDFGSGERSIASALELSAAVGRRLSPRWEILLAGENLLNEDYFLSADRKASQAEGRSVAVRFFRRDGS